MVATSTDTTGKRQLLLLRGLPGSGKTTLAKTLEALSAVPAMCVAADDWFYNEDGVYCFNQNRLPAAHRWCQEKVLEGMKDRLNLIIVHNTFTTEKEMSPYISMAKDYGYRVSTVIVENRHGNRSVHGVPDEVMGKMEKRFAIQLDWEDNYLPGKS